MKADVDHVVCHDAEAHPAFHALGALVSGPIQSMPPFENTDAAFAPGAPLLSFLEPALLLLRLPFLTFGGAAGNRDPLHAQFFGCGLVGG